jgi:hypothetical protein
MTIQSGPFFELKNSRPSEISNHFSNWKGTAQDGPFSKLENGCPQINDMPVLPPNLESHLFPFS